MLVTQSTEQIQKQFLDSMYLISHSKKTIATYKTALNHFKKFTLLHYNCDELHIVEQIKSDKLDLYAVIRDFIIYLDQKQIRPRGIHSYLSGLKGFLRHMGLKINSDDFKQLVKIPRVVKTREIPVTKEMILRVLHNSSPKLQTAILVCTSSGLRIGELVQLKLSDIDFESNPTKINIRSEIAKGSMSRETFITTETTHALQDYLKRYFGWIENNPNLNLQNTMIFGRISDVKTGNTPEFSLDSAKQILQASLRKQIENIPELNIKNENGLLAIHFHALRKFFRTTLGNACGRDYAEALMGHGFYMDTYYQLPEEKKKQMYLDAEPHLTISDYEAIKHKINSFSIEQKKLKKIIEKLRSDLISNNVPVPQELLRI
jgi:integrase